MDTRPSSAARCWTWSKQGSVLNRARDLDISNETIYAWRRQDRIDRGLAPGLTSIGKTELATANKRIVELVAGLAVHRRH